MKKLKRGERRCSFCHIIIGKGHLNEEVIKLKLFRRVRKICGWCFEDLIEMDEPSRTNYYRRKRELDNKQEVYKY